jgi:hypothetical protein
MLTKTEKRQLESYESLMAMPKWKYILIYGVLAWGLILAIVVSLVNIWMEKDSFSHMIRNDLGGNLVGFPIGGIFFGLFMRAFLPRQIKKLKAKEQIAD